MLRSMHARLFSSTLAFPSPSGWGWSSRGARPTSSAACPARPWRGNGSRAPGRPPRSAFPAGRPRPPAPRIRRPPPARCRQQAAASGSPSCRVRTPCAGVPSWGKKNEAGENTTQRGQFRRRHFWGRATLHENMGTPKIQIWMSVPPNFKFGVTLGRRDMLEGMSGQSRAKATTKTGSVSQVCAMCWPLFKRFFHQNLHKLYISKATRGAFEQRDSFHNLAEYHHGYSVI